MGNPLIGMNAIIGLGEQSDFSTPVTADHWLPILRQSLEASADIRDIPYLGVANNQLYHNTRDSVLVARMVGGDIETCALYDDKAFLLLLKHAMGGVVTTGPSSTQYTHTFGCDTDALVAGLTAKAVLGSGITNRAEIFTGLRVNVLELACDAQSWMTAKASCIGKVSGGPIALSGTPAFAAAEEVLGGHGGVFAWNGHTPNMRSFRVTLNNNLIRRPYIGSFDTDALAPGGFATIDFEATFPWEDNDLYTDFRALVESDATIDFTGSGDNSMRLGLNNLKIRAVSRPVDRAGELTYTVRARCSDNPGTDQGLSIVVKNSNTTAI